MKNIIKQWMVSLALLFVTTGIAQSQIRSAVIGIDGLTCSMCARGTESAMRRSGFISDMKIDLNTMEATVTFDTTKIVSIDRVAKLIDDAGFTVRFVKVVMDFNGVPVDDGYHHEFQGAQYHFVGATRQVLNGPTTLQFVDKELLSKSKRKTWEKRMANDPCYASGRAESCCAKPAPNSDVPMRVYHVVLADTKLSAQ